MTGAAASAATGSALRPAGGGAPIVAAQNLVVAFGGVRALDGVNLTVHEGEAVAVVGPNGAGKSTLLSALSGARKPTSGSLVVAGQDMTSRTQGYRMARAGVGLAHQVPKPFAKLTVHQNIEAAAQVLPGRERRPAAAEAMQFAGLQDMSARPAGTLGLLDLKRLELARALALKPSLLLLDEVAAGLNGSDLDELISLLQRARAFIPTLILVEHVQDVVHEIAERALVLEWGRLIAEGTPGEVSRDPKVIASYLGTTTDQAPIERRAPAEGHPVLEVSDVSVRYGHVAALRGVSLDVRPGEIVGVIGANGAGKSSLAKAVIGAVPAVTGRVAVAGHDVTSARGPARVAAGVAICPEGRRLFSALTVEENLELGLRSNRDRSQLEAAYEMFPKLGSLRHRTAGSLSGGEQQMVAIGRAIASNPRVIVMDEVSLGLAPVIVDRLYEAILSVQAWGMSVLLVEQSIHRTRQVSNRVLLLEQGRVVYWGAPDALGDDVLHQAYLGGGGPLDGPDGRAVPQEEVNG